MKYRVVEWQAEIYIVLGIGTDSQFDPPDCYYAVPLKYSIFRSIILNKDLVKIPFSEAIEITDENKIRAILILYG